MINNIGGQFAQSHQKKAVKFKSGNTEAKAKEKKPAKKTNDDPLLKYPARLLAYTNEVGEAVRPAIEGSLKEKGTTVADAFWMPALLYIGADVWDKYKRGDNDDYSKPSWKRGVEEGVFQGLASVALPTTAIKMSEKLAEKTGVISKIAEKTKIKHHYVASAIGLATLGVVMKPLDVATEKFVEHVVKPMLNKNSSAKKPEANKPAALDKQV